MKYEPKILENPKNKRVEFFCGGICYSVEPGERKPFDGFVAHHALRVANTGLIEVGAEKTQKTVENISNDLKLDKMSWNELRGIAGGIYKVGMSKRVLLKALKEKQND